MAVRVDGLSYRLIARNLRHEPRIRRGNVRSDGVVAMRLLLLALLHPAQPATGNDHRRACAHGQGAGSRPRWSPIMSISCMRYSGSTFRPGSGLMPAHGPSI